MAFKVVVETSDVIDTVNVGNPNTIILKEAVVSIASKLKRQEKLEFGAIEYREDQVMKLQPLCEKLTKAGWKPQVEFEEGISHTLKWLNREDANTLNLINNQAVSFNLPTRP